MAVLVSVLIPTFNGERFLGETLESVLAQDHPSVEIIVCDDGSTDGTLRVLEAFGDRIRVLRQPNAGPAAARNRAAGAARGTIFAFVDHDDLWEPFKLSRQVRRLTEEPGLGLVFAESRIIDASGRMQGLRGSRLHYAEGSVFPQLLRGNFVPIETLAVPAGVFRGLGGFDPSLRYLEDWELCLRIARTRRIGFDPEPLARYRIHDRNLTHDREALAAEWGALLKNLPSRFPDLAADERRRLDHEGSRRLGDAAWKALRRCDLAAADRWRALAGPIHPRSLAARIRITRALLGILPLRLARRLMAVLPHRHADEEGALRRRRND